MPSTSPARQRSFTAASPLLLLAVAHPMPEDDEEAAARERAQRYIKFGTVTEKNVEQLRKLNLAVFPVR